MSTSLGKWLAVLWLASLSLIINVALGAPQQLHLLGHSSFDAPQLHLKEPDWRWLRERRTLVMGVSAPDYAPFDLTNNNDELEGITADYAALIAQMLNVTIQVQRYEHRDDVIAALKRGEVDFLGTANGYEAADRQLKLSRSYANDQPTLVTRVGDSQALSAELEGKRLAMLYHYMQPEVVAAYYANASLQLYPSTFEAIGAVAFGQADVYLGDAISTNYLINKNHLNNVRMADFSSLEVNPFAFAVDGDNLRLLRIVNAALELWQPGGGGPRAPAPERQ